MDPVDDTNYLKLIADVAQAIRDLDAGASTCLWCRGVFDHEERCPYKRALRRIEEIPPPHSVETKIKHAPHDQAARVKRNLMAQEARRAKSKRTRKPKHLQSDPKGDA